jgi:hypothetical protein
LLFGISEPYNLSMNIQNLRYFATVAKLENVSRAAELMHTSQSSISKNILTLEEELGTKLFEYFVVSFKTNCHSVCLFIVERSDYAFLRGHCLFAFLNGCHNIAPSGKEYLRGYKSYLLCKLYHIIF